MLEIVATTYRGNKLQERLAARFDEHGGTIGRSEENRLFLPDPERHVSRVHAEVLHTEEGYFIISRGTNPVQVNQVPLPQGSRVRIHDSDVLQIGGYALAVRIEESLLPGAAAPNVVDAARQAMTEGDDPLGLGPENFGSGGRESELGWQNSPQSLRGVERGSSEAGAEAIDDTPRRAPPPPNSARTADSSREWDSWGVSGGTPGSGQSLNDLFDLGPSGGGDPLADSPLGDASPSKGNFYPGPQRDDLPEIRSKVRLSSVVEPSPPMDLRPTSAVGVASESERVESSWVDSDRPFHPPKSPSEAAPSSSPSQSAPAPALQRPDASPPETSKEVLGPSRSESDDPLVRALMEGLGVADLELPARLNPELMRLIGELLRESIKGTLELVMTRALTRKEIQTDLTLVSSKRLNNPLKHSPNVEVALGHLFAPEGRGFMPPVASLRDAYRDLQSHQMGFMAGMQAAVASVLARFRPEDIEGKLHKASAIDSIWPLNRRAKAWAAYIGHYQEIANETSQDFHTMFGKEFLRAYEAQVERFRASENRGEK